MTEPTQQPTAPGPIRAIAIISDLHLGSDCSILQPDFLTEKAQPIGQTPLAAWLYECWTQAHAWLAEILLPKEYALIINGDCIEGNHHRTTEIWSPDVRNHVKAAIELLAPVAARAGKVFMVKGTPCHVNGGEPSSALRSCRTAWLARQSTFSTGAACLTASCPLFTFAASTRRPRRPFPYEKPRSKDRRCRHAVTCGHARHIAKGRPRRQRNTSRGRRLGNAPRAYGVHSGSHAKAPGGGSGPARAMGGFSRHEV